MVEKTERKGRVMKSALGIIATELFQVSFVAYLILLLMESMIPGFVSEFFDLRILFSTVVASGLVTLLPISERKWKNRKHMLQSLLRHAFEQWDEEVNRVKSRWEWLFVFVVSYGGGLLVYYKTSSLGNISFVLAFFTGIIIWLLSHLILAEQEE